MQGQGVYLSDLRCEEVLKVCVEIRACSMRRLSDLAIYIDMPAWLRSVPNMRYERWILWSQGYGMRQE